MRVSILVPVYQEEATVGELLTRVAACNVASEGFEREILVCDDGSTDRTRAEIERAAARLSGVRVFFHARNRGKGAAIRTLLKHVTGDVVLVQDADLEYEVDDCLPMLRRYREGADAVYGSRFAETWYPAGMRLPNWIANRVLTATANALYGLHITDEATCLKLVRADLLEEMQLQCRGFDFCPEVTAKLGRRRARVVEVPVRYSARDHASGKKVRWWDGLIALVVLIEQRWR